MENSFQIMETGEDAIALKIDPEDALRVKVNEALKCTKELARQLRPLNCTCLNFLIK